MMRRLAKDIRGVTLIEFSIMLPAMLTMIMGSIEMGHMLYARQVLEGATVEAARKATASLETKESDRTKIMRDTITNQMAPFPLAKNAKIDIATKVYADFSSAFPETYDDVNKNDSYDVGEPYVDRNKNGKWDNTTPKAGTLGGPGDVVSYTVTFPKALLFGYIGSIIGIQNGTINLKATTVVRNEAVERSNS